MAISVKWPFLKHSIVTSICHCLLLLRLGRALSECSEMEHQGLLFHPAMRGCPLNVPWLLLCCFRCYSHLVLVGTAVLTVIGFSFAFLIVGPACQVSMILCCAFGDKCPHLVLKLFFFKRMFSRAATGYVPDTKGCL